MNKDLMKIIFGAVCFAAAWACPEGAVRTAGFVAAYLCCGAGVLLQSVRHIFRGDFLDENFLMALATACALAIGEYPEAAAVMLFYQTGEFFMDWAQARSRRSVRALMELKPRQVRVQDGGVWKEVPPEQVAAGTVFLVKPGERVPLDGVVLRGRAWTDGSALTGESAPVEVSAGAEVFAGVISLDGVLQMRALRPYAHSAVARILKLVEESSSKKTPTERFITRFARYYTPAVVLAAVLCAVLPPLFFPQAQLRDWVYRALVFLVISCPCALVLSVPMGFFGGIGAAARRGVLLKGSGSLEALAHGEIMVFDKTGTLTTGHFGVSGVFPAEGFTAPRLLELAAYAESVSNHPLAAAVCKAYGKDIDPARLGKAEEQAGRGVCARVDGVEVFAGSGCGKGAEWKAPAAAPGTAVFVWANGKYAGAITLADQLKPEATRAVAELKQAGFSKVVMLTGDCAPAAQAVAQQAGVDEFYAGLLPAEKVARVEQLLNERTPGRTLLFAGDGINDAPVLARADVGIAMGAFGSDAAVEAADVVLGDDNPARIAQAVRLSRFTLRVVKQNIGFSLGVKAVVLALGAAGLANLWEAVFADVGVSVLAVLNALRPLAYKEF